MYYHISDEFRQAALAVYQKQATKNALYREYHRLLGKDPKLVRNLEQIPFMPISFFKTHLIKTGKWREKTTFTSSGTTGQTPSQHLVRLPEEYLKNSVLGFSKFYGHPKDWCILALLPSYLEREGSSLVAMVEHFIKKSKYRESGFFLHDFEALNETINICKSKHYKNILLLGVSFALLDFAEKHPQNLSNLTIMETGGMKGRRKEWTREELHHFLKTAFQCVEIHSEYGMTELFSQAYAQQNGLFHPSETMNIFCTELYDPFAFTAYRKTGLLQMIDLANSDTCAFIATEDLGRVFENGGFEVLGRADFSEMRGCNLMVD